MAVFEVSCQTLLFFVKGGSFHLKQKKKKKKFVISILSVVQEGKTL